MYYRSIKYLNFVSYLQNMFSKKEKKGKKKGSMFDDDLMFDDLPVILKKDSGGC